MKKKKLSYWKAKAWKAIRDYYLALNPTCEMCNQNDAQAVHHIIPKAQGNLMYFNWDNFISVCNGCHFSWHWKMSPGQKSEILERERPNFADVEKLIGNHAKYRESDYKKIIELHEDLLASMV